MKIAPLRPADGMIAAVAVCMAFLLFAVSNFGKQTGTQVVVEAAGRPAAVYDLNKPTEITVSGRSGLSLTVTIVDGRVRVTQSECPDHLCEHTGWLSRGGQSAVCVPAGITVRITGGDNAVDGVTS